MIRIALILIIVVFNSNILMSIFKTQLVVPTITKSHSVLPIVVRVYDDNHKLDKLVKRDFLLSANGTTTSIQILRGTGCINILVEDENPFHIQNDELGINKAITVLDADDLVVIEENITTDVTWTKEKLRHITTDLTISHGATLTIEAGCMIYINEKSNIKVEGKIDCKGTAENPVIFNSFESSSDWGGISFNNQTQFSEFQYTIFINGGADEKNAFGHSNSQPVIYAKETELFLNNCFLIYNTGKAFGTELSELNIDSCLISNCDTGGEFVESTINIDNTYVLNIPDNSTNTVDDDNDALYFLSAISKPSSIDNCIFIHGKDDAIDHNMANMEIKNCWIEDFANEGIACSNQNKITVFNTIIRDCDQGIEAGYGSPEVIVDHCVIVENDVGLRFGDSYDWGCDGLMSVTNSILYGNDDNILNYDLKTNGAVAGAINISYSITNDEDYNSYPNCTSAVPIFDELYYLKDNSPGKNAASDSKDMGLIEYFTTVRFETKNELVALYPNPAADYIEINITDHWLNPKVQCGDVKIFDLLGKEVTIRLFDKSTPIYPKESESTTREGCGCVMNISHLKPGIYFIKVANEFLKFVKI